MIRLLVLFSLFFVQKWVKLGQKGKEIIYATLMLFRVERFSRVRYAKSSKSVHST